MFHFILNMLKFLKLLICLFFNNLFSLICPCKKNFAGEIVLITGSGNGIGRQIALKLAPLEATLVLWDIDDKNNEETSKLAKKHGAKRVFTYHCDCSNREQVYEQADKVRREVGDVTILINNAGILPGKKFLDTADTDFEKTLSVNFFSQVWTLKAFLPAMVAANRGHLVNTASAAGFWGPYRATDYSASKAAIIEMMEALDSELHHTGKCGIKTTIICPYFINTKLARGFKSQTCLLPVYEPDYAASRIVDAIRREKFYLIMPLTVYLFAFKIFIPRKIILFIESWLKIPDSMEKAYGQRKGIENKVF